VGTWVAKVFCNFCLVKNHKIANKLAATKAREKIAIGTELKSTEY
jgi:hypothetical protein